MGDFLSDPFGKEDETTTTVSQPNPVLTQLFQAAEPLREPLVEFLTDIFSGEGPRSLVVPGREALEEQFAVSRENIIGRTPTRGGQLNRALIENEQRRAQAIGSLRAHLQARALGPAVSAAFRIPAAAFGGFGTQTTTQPSGKKGDLLEATASVLPFIL